MSLDTKTATGVGNWVTDLESRFSNVWKVKANARADKATACACANTAAELWLGKQCFVYLHQGDEQRRAILHVHIRWSTIMTDPQVSACSRMGHKIEGKIQVTHKKMEQQDG